MPDDLDRPATRRDFLELAQRMERHENTILRAVRELGRTHKARIDSTEQRLSDLEQRLLDLETRGEKES